MITTLIFDFDGLILNTEKTEYISWQEMYASFEATLSLEVWQQQIGSTAFDAYAHLEGLVGKPVNRETLSLQRRQRDNELLLQETILPGVEAYLAEAKAFGLQIGLASSSEHRWVDAHLQRLGLLPYFEVVACRDDVGDRAKPDPAVYRFALQQLGALPQQTLALEDSLNGVLAARAAGVWVTAVPHDLTRSLNFDQAHYQLHSLADIPLSELITAVLNGKSHQHESGKPINHTNHS
jgi:HAD superfamily hydrolase (TIGR01509 family)